MIENDNKTDGVRALKQKRSELERQRQSLSSDINVLDAAITVMDSQERRVEFVILPKPTEAVVKLLLNNTDKGWLFSEIIEEINKTGVSSNAPNISSSVSSALRNLAKAGNIIITGVKRKRQYWWNTND